MNKKNRNAYMLDKAYRKNGYDWWWHDITAIEEESGNLSRFFIEYYVINPDLSKSQTKTNNRKPSYAKIIAGKWGDNKAQLHAYYSSQDFKASKNRMDLRIGKNIASEKELKGSISVSKESVPQHSELKSDFGEMKWDLIIKNKVTYSVGYGASYLFRKLHLFQMYWHVGGLRTKYSGIIYYNKKKYIVKPEYTGYQDKNWGSDYTNPWIWLNCNQFFDSNDNKIDDLSFVVGGGKPKILGIPLKGKILVALWHKNKIYDFNFTKLFFQKQKWHCKEDDNSVYWSVNVENRTKAMDIEFKCLKENMIKINYENPKGIQNHKNLWNGGHAFGTIKLYNKRFGKKILEGEYFGNYAGCEYGAF